MNIRGGIPHIRKELPIFPQERLPNEQRKLNSLLWEFDPQETKTYH